MEMNEFFDPECTEEEKSYLQEVDWDVTFKGLEDLLTFPYDSITFNPYIRKVYPPPLGTEQWVPKCVVTIAVQYKGTILTPHLIATFGEDVLYVFDKLLTLLKEEVEKIDDRQAFVARLTAHSK